MLISIGRSIRVPLFRFRVAAFPNYWMRLRPAWIALQSVLERTRASCQPTCLPKRHQNLEHRTWSPHATKL